MLCNIIKNLFKNRLKSIEILDIQNISLFVISLYSFFLCIYYNLILLFNPNNQDSLDIIIKFDTLSSIVSLYLFIDFFFSKTYSSILHHSCVFGIILYNNYYDLSLEDRFIFLYPLLKTEISSIFYILKYWIPSNTIIYNVNILLFYLSFLKFRIYDFYYEIIYNNIYFDIVFKKYSELNYILSSILIVSCYILYTLNLYWFLIMNKIIFKKITNFINIKTDILSNKISCYIHIMNIPLLYYIYRYDINQKNIIDLIGVIILSTTSYKYYKDVCGILYYKKNEDCYIRQNEQNILLFLNDMLSINTRSFLVIITNYYNTEYLFCILSISVVFLFLANYNCIVNILKLFIVSDKNIINFYTNHNICISIPIIIDTLLLFINLPAEVLIPFLLINITIILLSVVEPFYKLTHVIINLLLVLQNYYICLSSSIK